MKDTWPITVLLVLFALELLLLLYAVLGIMDWAVTVGGVLGWIAIGEYMDQTGMSDNIVKWLKRRRSSRRAR